MKRGSQRADVGEFVQGAAGDLTRKATESCDLLVRDAHDTRIGCAERCSRLSSDPSPSHPPAETPMNVVPWPSAETVPTFTIPSRTPTSAVLIRLRDRRLRLPRTEPPGFPSTRATVAAQSVGAPKASPGAVRAWQPVFPSRQVEVGDSRHADVYRKLAGS